VVILGFDLVKAFTPDVSLFEMVVRGAIMYFSIFILLRVILRGRTSAVTMSDLIVIVVIADAAQNAMSAEYSSVTDGIVLVATIVICSFSVDWLAFRFPIVRNFVHPERTTLVMDGRILRKALEEELMTEGELMTQLRLHEVETLDEVKAVYLEGNGEVSVIKRPGVG
jgi:uncharacterized membrane protein YcaP (DUF421 family)